MLDYLFQPPSRRLSPLLLAAAFCVAAAASAEEYHSGPAPSWVEPVTSSTGTRDGDRAATDGTDYLLTDVQVRVSGTAQTQYVRVVRRAVNTNGVERVSNISITFDPAYQKLTLNRVIVHRGAETIDMLARSTLRVLQREKELEYQVYDGSKTLNIVIPDVRIGDIVEYHYTRDGANPVFSGIFQGFVDLQWSVQVDRMHYRLLWPTGRKLFIQKHRTDLEPTIRARGEMTEYRWSRQNIPALSADPGRPDWYDPYPWVQLSESPNWGAVSQWARNLFDPDGDEAGTPAMRAAASRVSSASTPEQRVLDILRYTQEEIRYLGIEMGERSHAPSSPKDVMERRFGDCKDKTRLMVALLRASDIEARPALVHTGIRRAVADHHPSMTIFNHAIVHVRLNGKSYWLDPTLKYQKGTLDTLYQPDYEKALIVAPQTTGLTDMNVAVQPHTKVVQEILNLRGPRDQPAAFSVATMHERYYADSMRQSLATESRDEIQKKYTNYYVKTYPGARANKRFEVTDDGVHNRLTLTEHYDIRNIWVTSEDTKTISVSFNPSLLLDAIKKPDSPMRSMPLHVAHPVHFRHTTTVLLPEGWNIKNSEDTVSDPAFVFQRRIAYRNNMLTLDYDYRSLRDSVEAKQVGQYVVNVGRLRDMLGYEIYQPVDTTPPAPKPGGHDTNWPILVLLVMATFLWCLAGWLAYRYDPPQMPKQPADPGLSGIRGWLVLPGIGLLLTPLRVVYEQRDTLHLLSAQAWSQAISADSASPWLGLMIIAELVLNVGVIVFAILLIILFFQKRHTLPRLYIVYMVSVTLYMAGDLFAAADVLGSPDQISSKDKVEMMRTVIGTAIWVWYFLVSKRVRATFIERRRA